MNKVDWLVGSINASPEGKPAVTITATVITAIAFTILLLGILDQGGAIHLGGSGDVSWTMISGGITLLVGIGALLLILTVVSRRLEREAAEDFCEKATEKAVSRLSLVVYHNHRDKIKAALIKRGLKIENYWVSETPTPLIAIFKFRSIETCK